MTVGRNFVMSNELYNLFSSVLTYLETIDYKSANNLALELSDVDSLLISDFGFPKERINSIIIKLLMYSIETNPDITNLSAFQYVCFGMDDGISKIINLNHSNYYDTDSVGVINNLALAYFVSGNIKKALQIQRIAVSKVHKDFLKYDNQKDLIYFNQMIYEVSYYKRVNDVNKKVILQVLSSAYVYDFEYTLLVAMLYNDYEYFKSNYKKFSLFVNFDTQVGRMFNKYIKTKISPDLLEILKYLKPLPIYDKLLYT